MPERSNLRIRSNVYWRDQGRTIVEDRKLTSLFRGRAAVKQLLSRLGVPPSEHTSSSTLVRQLVRQGAVTQAQARSLDWHTACARCGEIPCGLTFDGRVEMRCAVADCVARKTVGRALAIPVDLVELLAGGDPSERLVHAIERCGGVPPAAVSPHGPKVRIPVAPHRRSPIVISTTSSAFLAHGLTNGGGGR